MLRLLRFTPMLALLAFATVALAHPVFAQAETPPITAGDIVAALANYGDGARAFVGALGLLAALVNLAKARGWLKDGQAMTAVIGVGLAGLLIRFGLQTWAPQVDLAAVDDLLGEIGELVMVVTGSKLFHRFVLSGTPIVGKSFSAG